MKVAIAILGSQGGNNLSMNFLFLKTDQKQRFEAGLAMKTVHNRQFSGSPSHTLQAFTVFKLAKIDPN